MPRPNDTIAALATPVGTGALALLRISGPDTAALTAAFGLAPGGAPLPRVARYVDYRAGDGTLVDDVVMTFFAGPRSYTGEDVLEISCHGNPFIAQKLLEDLLARGCRLAEPGEFTQRAFLNGRMDLSQAEAVMDLIQARSERALAAAHDQRRGALGRRMDLLVDRLLGVIARVEAYIDFPEEDLPANDQATLDSDLALLAAETDRLLATSHYGAILRDGIKTVIVGEPNVGKSSLLNRLVGRDRALVSPEPGTTRDFIEERVIVGPHGLRLIDTAGLNVAPAALERLGMEKTWERVEEADLVLVVFDVSRPAPVLAEWLNRIRPEIWLTVANKSDLPAAATLPPELAPIPVSARTGAGIEVLKQAIVRRADGLRADNGSETIAISARHSQALNAAKAAFADARSKNADRAPSELLAADLRAALAAYGEIVGRVDNERMLDQLFASFCIGK